LRIVTVSNPQSAVTRQTRPQFWEGWPDIEIIVDLDEYVLRRARRHDRID